MARRFHFEPLTVEDVLSIYEKEKPEGVIVQFGGQTPLNIASELAGIHSGDSACVIPPISIATKHLDAIYEYTPEIIKKVAGDGSFQALDASYPIDEAYWPNWIKGEVERYHRYRS